MTGKWHEIKGYNGKKELHFTHEQDWYVTATNLKLTDMEVPYQNPIPGREKFEGSRIPKET